MVSITEQFSTFQLQSLKAMQAYALASLNGVEKLTELNLQAAKTSVEEGVSTSVALFNSRDPKALANTVSVQAKPHRQARCLRQACLSDRQRDRRRAVEHRREADERSEPADVRDDRRDFEERAGRYRRDRHVLQVGRLGYELGLGPGQQGQQAGRRADRGQCRPGQRCRSAGREASPAA